MKDIALPPPSLQIGFAERLERVRKEYLMDALLVTVSTMKIADLDKELGELVPQDSMARLAANGLRAELMFAAPSVLERNPKLLTYYRLILGHSSKELYRTSKYGMQMFQSMETEGTLNDSQRLRLGELCDALIKNATLLLDGLKDPLTVQRLDDLSLLTLGPNWRGQNNNSKGTDAIQVVVGLIRDIVGASATKATKKKITLRNTSGREVAIQFGTDPDIVIRERLSRTDYANKVAIEVKGGEDKSNIHNRLGEAEKSHQKARGEGYTECWTIVNVDGLSKGIVKTESPTTDRVYLLSKLAEKSGSEWVDFKARLISIIGLRS